MQLLIMAGGMGSRFGGLKQIEPFGPNGEFLIDYSIYDAIKAGFDKVVFVIREENYQVFKDTIGARVEPFIEVEYVFQKMDDVPNTVNIPENRVKPWGTAHAILACKNAITDKFIIINADDFYGYDAYRVAASFLKNSIENEYAVVGYKIINTMTENGAVKRGVLKLDENKNLLRIIESSVEFNENHEIMATPLSSKDEPFMMKPDDLISQNMLAFDTSIFPFLEEQFVKFFEDNKDNLEKCEFLIPDVLDAASKEYAAVKVLKTDAVWHGVTYREDTEWVKKAINEEVESGKYPKNLWNRDN